MDGKRGQTFESGNHREQIASPQRLVRRFGLGNVNAQWMLQRAEVHLISHHCDVEKRGREQFAGQNSSLVQVQSAGPRENKGGTGIGPDTLVPLPGGVWASARE